MVKSWGLYNASRGKLYAHKATGEVVEAWTGGRCKSCGEHYAKGDRVVRRATKLPLYVHEECPPPRFRCEACGVPLRRIDRMFHGNAPDAVICRKCYTKGSAK